MSIGPRWGGGSVFYKDKEFKVCTSFQVSNKYAIVNKDDEEIATIPIESKEYWINLLQNLDDAKQLICALKLHR